MWIIYAVGLFFFVFCLINAILAKKNTEYGITFIAGEIGAGKSTLAVKMARKYLKAGWTVYSTDYIRGCFKLDVNDLNSLMAKPNSLLIIDEASLKMNSRQFAQIKLSLIEYFKLSRHCKNKIIMISQTFGDTDKQIRDLSTHVYFVRKILNGLVSVPVKVRARLDIGQDGQPTMMYKIGHFGKIILLFRYRKYFNSFDDFHREYIADIPWDSPEQGDEVQDSEHIAPKSGDAGHAPHPQQTNFNLIDFK